MSDITIAHTIRSRPFLTTSAIRRIVSYVLARERVTGSVSVHIVGRTKMQQLNTIYRGVAAPTDVLSFETGEQWSSEIDLGDIFLCQPYIQAQAKRFGVTAVEEASRMLVHGVLHLLGYDHMKEADAVQMFKKQETYLKQCT